MNKIIAAIVEDDPTTVKRLLEADPGLATNLIQKPRLYRSGIFHWIYVGDTYGKQTNLCENEKVSDGGGNEMLELVKQCRPPPFAPR